MQINATKLAQLLDVAKKAIEVDELEVIKRQEEKDLTQAYWDFKSRLGVTTILEKGSPGFLRMVAATKGEYAAVEEARRKVQNAKKRLRSAIKRYKAD